MLFSITHPASGTLRSKRRTVRRKVIVRRSAAPSAAWFPVLTNAQALAALQDNADVPLRTNAEVAASFAERTLSAVERRVYENIQIARAEDRRKALDPGFDPD